MILLKLNRYIKEPLFQQIVEQLKKHIDSGDIAVGESLPSSRKLSESIGVHRSTVVRAYEELWAAGYIESQSGGYSRVRQRNQIIHNTSRYNTSLIDWNDRFSDSVLKINNYQIVPDKTADKVVDFRPMNPDLRLLPVGDFKKSFNKVIGKSGSSLLSYGSALGYQPLRELIACNMRQHGIAVDDNEIILTNGIQNGLELVLRTLTTFGDSIVVESPTYSKFIELIKYLGLKPISISMNDVGMDLKELERVLKEFNPRLIYTVPTFHNPTGISSSQSHREELLSLAECYKVPIVEDGFEEDMKYFGKAVMPIKSMDRNQVVIYLGTFSKVLFPGVRTGWIVGNTKLIKKIGALKSVCELSGVAVVQAAVHQMCVDGYYEQHKKRMHRAYRKRMSYALQLCREYLNYKWLKFTKPDGGYLIWFTLNIPEMGEKELIDLLKMEGVLVSSGSSYYCESSNRLQFRVSIACRNEAEIEIGFLKMKECFNNINSQI